MYVGKRRLDAGQTHDAQGRLRLCYGTPDWLDFVSLAVTEIRHYGAGSMQVARRLQAMLEHLLRVLPDARRAALQQELVLLRRAIQRRFPDEEDRARARGRRLPRHRQFGVLIAYPTDHDSRAIRDDVLSGLLGPGERPQLAESEHLVQDLGESALASFDHIEDCP